jgi:hypothetical protein
MMMEAKRIRESWRGLIINQKKVGNLWKHNLVALMKWRWLWNSPAKPNDCLELELSGAWEPPASLDTPLFGASKEAQPGFLDGNQA